MSLSFYVFSGLIALLLVLLAWSLRKPKAGTATPSVSDALENGRPHVTHLAQMQLVLAKTDYEFLSQKAPKGLLRRVRRERRNVAIAYLFALREDFHRLLRMAKVIAALSPKVRAVQEFERFRLTIRFFWRFEMIRLKLTMGIIPLRQVDRLANVVSGLSVRIERAVSELGERAALSSELASALHRGSIDSV